MVDEDARDLFELTAYVNRIAPDLLRDSQEHRRFIEQIEASITSMSSPFDQFVFNDRLTAYAEQVAKQFSQADAAMKRHREAHLLVSKEQPKRGWYLSGHEPC